MKRTPLRQILLIFAVTLLIGSVIFGFFMSFGMRQKIEEDQEFFSESLLDQSSILNRVIFAAQEYAVYPRPEEKKPGWIAKKTELSRQLVSYAMIPQVVGSTTYKRVMRDDPLLLAERLDESAAAYDAVYEELVAVFARLAAAEDDSRREILLANSMILSPGFSSN